MAQRKQQTRPVAEQRRLDKAAEQVKVQEGSRNPQRSAVGRGQRPSANIRNRNLPYDTYISRGVEKAPHV